MDLICSCHIITLNMSVTTVHMFIELLRVVKPFPSFVIKSSKGQVTSGGHAIQLLIQVIVIHSGGSDYSQKSHRPYGTMLLLVGVLFRVILCPPDIARQCRSPRLSFEAGPAALLTKEIVP